MQSSAAPTKIQLPFAATGTKNTIPVPSQQGITPGAASFTDGFPPLTFTPLSAGGVPPAGADFNGIFNALSAIQQWQSAGGSFKYDATFSTAIGGYPQGAMLLNSSGTGLWICTTENNTTNPDAAGAGWLAFSPSSIQSGINSVAPDTGTVNAYAIALSPAPAALTPGMVVTILNVANTNTGAATLNVNGLGALPIVLAAGAALNGGELVLGYGATMRLNRTGAAWELMTSSGWSLQKGMIAYTSTGSFTVPAGVTTLYVSGCGGGGGGGGGGASQITGTYVGGNGAGGGAGQSTFRKAIAVTPGNVIPVTIGAGGSAGAAGTTGGATGGTGGSGGATSLGALLTLSGGSGGGGANSSPSVGLGGQRGAGYPAGSVGCNVADGALATGPSGAGASSPFGGGGGAVRASTDPSAGAAGGDGGGYGSGGAGGAGQVASSQSYAGGPGGAGAPGLLIIEW